MDIEWMTAVQLREAYQARSLSPMEVARALLARIERVDRRIHAFLALDPEAVLAQARRAEAALYDDEPLGPLHGVPISLKDTIDAAGLRCTSGSIWRADRIPAEDAISVARLRAAGAIILGKTNTSEFATCGRTVNRLGLETVNPWDTSRTSAGSSGGSGAAVAAGMGPIAIGTDAGGSIRYPAAFNGVFGLMASSDLVPKLGNFEINAFGSPFSSIGPLARSVRDAALALQAMAGHDPRDAMSSRRPVPDYLAACDEGVKGLRVGWVTPPASAHREPGVEEAVRAACDGFESLGASVGALSETLPVPSDISGPIMGAAFQEIRRLAAEPGRRRMLSPYVVEWLAAPTPTPEQEAAAWALRRAAQARMRDIFGRVDLIASPVTCFPAPRSPQDPFANFLPYDRYTTLPAVANVLGLAASAIPCGMHEGLPIALMLMAPRGQEACILRASAAFERAWPWADRRPPVD
ncbi:MAG: amidase [Caulobacteraceae bacterium]|nr:amidase [Caulobacteraceae bacterium]